LIRCTWTPLFVDGNGDKLTPSTRKQGKRSTAEKREEQLNYEQRETPGDYEVGYGKPPKATQFQRGRSGNPKGRRKKAPDFDRELIRESQTLLIVNENGRRKRISKHGVVLKQLMKHAMTGILRPFASIWGINNKH